MKDAASTEIITKSFSAPMFGINEYHLMKINDFLNNDKFKYVRWNLSVDVGGAKSITLFVEKGKNPLPYKYGVQYRGAAGGKLLGWIAKVFTGWNEEKAIKQFQRENPNYKIKNIRTIHNAGINYAVYILYTYSSENFNK